MGIEMKNKQGQITLFIIIAIIIVAGIIVLFLVLPSGPSGNASQVSNQLLDKCVGDALRDSIEKILMNGGFAEPNGILYKDEEYTYLCYQENYFLPCVNQYPDLIGSIEDEIKADIEDDVARCLIELDNEFRNQGWEVASSGGDFEVEVMPENVFVDIDRNVQLRKGGESQEFDGFEVQRKSDLGDLTLVAINIIEDESQTCNFDYNSYMILNPEYDIKSITYRDSEIYKIKNRQSQDEFRFAVRGCVIL